MRKLLLLSLITLATFGVAQKSRRPSKTAPSPQPASIPADPKISAALQQISAAQIKRTIDTLVSFGNRSTLSVEQPAASEHGITAAREWIKSEFERYSRDCGGCLEVKLDTFTQPQAERLTKPTEISNVYAVLRGTDPGQAKRMVLVTGHYDSRNGDNFNTTDPAPGANDDASGTAVSLECARVLSKLKFPAAIIFLAVAGEEQGLYGSAHFAKIAKDAGWQIEAVLNNDIVGGNRTPGDTGQNPHIVRVFSEGIPQAATEAEVRGIRALGAENDSPSRELARYIAEIGQAYSKDFQPTLIFRPDRYLRGGDHSSFNEQGYAAVRFTEWREDFNHQHQNVRTENGIEYGDLPKFVDFDYVANVARLNAATLAELASAPPPPSLVKLETKQLENSSTFYLQADVPRNIDVTMELLWRPTDAALWNRVPKSTGRMLGRCQGMHCDETGALTVPISKDNVFFAVRSVDAAGHRSLPVVPLPER